MIDGDGLVDVDGTAAKLVEYLMARIKPQFPGESLPKHDVPGLFDKGGPLTDRQLAAALKMMGSKGFVKNLPIIEGALEGTKKLRKALSERGRSLVWCTASWLSSETWDYDRRWWLEKRMYTKSKDVIFAHHKFMVRAAFLIDDRPDKLEAWIDANPGGLALLHDQPINRDYKNPKIKRFRWSDVDWLVEEMRKC